MELVRNMVESHPTFNGKKLDEIEECISECLICAETCSICADACLSEENSDLNKCIKNNLMCAQICETTAKMLAFQNDTHGALAHLLKACQQICQITKGECDEHADTMKHCQICADACDRCAQACENLLSA